MELCFVHVGERDATGVFAESAVGELDRVIVAGLDRHPRAIGVKGFARADAAGPPISDALEILLSRIQKRRLIAAERGQESCIAGNQFALVRRYGAAGRLPVFEAQIEKREKRR